MSIPQLILYLLVAGLTLLGVLVKENFRSINILVLQAAMIIVLNLSYYIEQILLGAYTISLDVVEALIIEFTVTVIAVPLVIRTVNSYILIKKIPERIRLQYTPPVISMKIFLISTLGFNIGFLSFTAYLISGNMIPSQLSLLPFAILVFVNAILGMIFNRDAVKIVVSLNMAFNAFTPLLSSLPLPYILLELTSLMLANIIVVFIVYEMVKKYNTLNVSEWSINYD